MSDNYPLVSVIVSTYNSERFIRGKIEDLLKQTIVDDLEIIIVNSGSQQNEDGIIREYLEEHKNIVYIKTEQRETIYKAWNRAIKEAKGKYITNANTDDRLRKDAYEILAKELDNNQEIALVFADQFISKIPNQNYDEVSSRKQWKIPEFDYLVQLDRCLVLSQPMWRASLHFVDNIWFDENLKICGDHEFEINLSAKYKIKHLHQTLGVFYVDKGRTNISLSNMQVLEKEKLQMTESYIIKYVDSLDEQNLLSLKRKFDFFVKIPIILLRGKNIIQVTLFPGKHRFTHEFIYFVTSLVYKKLREYDKAILYCRKLLKRKNSSRVKRLLNDLENLSV